MSQLVRATTPNTLKPFFPYYGSKYRIAPYYQRPLKPHIIEPFAGSAGYSHRYPHLQVTLYDVSPYIVGVWDYLINATVKEIMSLPDVVDDVRDHPNLPQEAKWLIGFWLQRGTSTPRLTASGWAKRNREEHPGDYWGPSTKRRIVSQLPRIRHWQINRESYENAPNVEACWFIDAPYQGQPGKEYRDRIADYSALGAWCRSRKGQVQVCEKQGAEWLPFRDFMTAKANNGTTSNRENTCKEVIWNLHS